MTKQYTDHDLLVRIDERVGTIDTRLARHLARHWAVALSLVSACLMLLATLVFSSAPGCESNTDICAPVAAVAKTQQHADVESKSSAGRNSDQRVVTLNVDGSGWPLVGVCALCVGGGAWYLYRRRVRKVKALDGLKSVGE